jgi:hypothetical protein
MFKEYRNKVMSCPGGKHDVSGIKDIEANDIVRTQLGYKHRGKCLKCGQSIVAKKMSEYVQFKE